MFPRLLSRLGPKRLQHQLMLLVAALFVGALLVYAKYTGEEQHALAVKLQERQALAWMQHLAAEMREVESHDTDPLEHYLEETREHAGADYLIVWRTDGSMRYISSASEQ